MKISEICRLCLVEDVELIWVFDQRLKHDKYMQDLIYNTIGVEINKEDLVSQKICTKCGQDVIKLYQFRQQSLKNDQYLKEQLKKLTVKKRPHESIIELYQIYPGLKLPHLEMCLTENISPIVEMELDQVEFYFKSKHLDMGKHAQQVLKQERLKERAENMLLKSALLKSKINTNISLTETVSPISIKYRQDKSSYEIVNKKYILEGNPNLGNHRKRQLSETEPSSPSKRIFSESESLGLKTIVQRRQTIGPIYSSSSESSVDIINKKTPSVNRTNNPEIISNILLRPADIQVKTNINPNKLRPSTESSLVHVRPNVEYNISSDQPKPIIQSIADSNNHLNPEMVSDITNKLELDILNQNMVRSSLCTDLNQNSNGTRPTGILTIPNILGIVPLSNPFVNRGSSEYDNGFPFQFNTKPAPNSIRNENQTFGSIDYSKKNLLPKVQKEALFQIAKFPDSEETGNYIHPNSQQQLDPNIIVDNHSVSSNLLPSEERVVINPENINPHLMQNVTKSSDLLEFTNAQALRIDDTNIHIPEINFCTVSRIIDSNLNATDDFCCKFCKDSFESEELCREHVETCYKRKAIEIPSYVLVEKIEHNEYVRKKYQNALTVLDESDEIIKIDDDDDDDEIQKEDISIKYNNPFLNITPNVEIKNSKFPFINNENSTPKVLEQLLISGKIQKPVIQSTQTDLAAGDPEIDYIIGGVQSVPKDNLICSDDGLVLTLNNFKSYLDVYKVPVSIKPRKDFKLSFNSEEHKEHKQYKHWGNLTPIDVKVVKRNGSPPFKHSPLPANNNIQNTPLSITSEESKNMETEFDMPVSINIETPEFKQILDAISTPKNEEKIKLPILDVPSEELHKILEATPPVQSNDVDKASVSTSSLNIDEKIKHLFQYSNTVISRCDGKSPVYNNNKTVSREVNESFGLYLEDQETNTDVPDNNNFSLNNVTNNITINSQMDSSRPPDKYNLSVTNNFGVRNEVMINLQMNSTTYNNQNQNCVTHQNYFNMRNNFQQHDRTAALNQHLNNVSTNLSLQYNLNHQLNNSSRGANLRNYYPYNRQNPYQNGIRTWIPPVGVNRVNQPAFRQPPPPYNFHHKIQEQSETNHLSEKLFEHIPGATNVNFEVRNNVQNHTKQFSNNYPYSKAVSNQISNGSGIRMDSHPENALLNNYNNSRANCNDRNLTDNYHMAINGRYGSQRNGGHKSISDTNGIRVRRLSDLK